MNWNRQQLERLKSEGKIRDFSDLKSEFTPVKRTIGGVTVSKHWPKRSKEKDYIAWNLLYWTNQHCFTLQEEYKFHPERKWRFDWYIDMGHIKAGIEYNGIMSEKSRHTTISGYTGDLDKINAAMGLGIRVLQFSPLNYKNLISELNKLFENGNKNRAVDERV